MCGDGGGERRVRIRMGCAARERTNETKERARLLRHQEKERGFEESYSEIRRSRRRLTRNESYEQG